MDGSLNYIENLGVRMAGERVCKNCGLDKLNHHYGVDGPGSGFLYQSTRLYCPGLRGTYSER